MTGQEKLLETPLEKLKTMPPPKPDPQFTHTIAISYYGLVIKLGKVFLAGD